MKNVTLQLHLAGVHPSIQPFYLISPLACEGQQHKVLRNQVSN